MCRCMNTREWNLGQLWYLKREKSHTSEVKWRVARERVCVSLRIFGSESKSTYKPKLKENKKWLSLAYTCMVRCWAVTALMDPVLSTQSGIISPWTATSFMALWLPGVCSEDYSKHIVLHHSHRDHGLYTTQFLQDILVSMTYTNV